MPEFIMPLADGAQSRAFRDLPAFTRGYVEALFFTSTGTSDDDLEDATFGDLSPAALASITSDCDEFLATLPRSPTGRTWLDLAADYAPDGYDDEQAGRDFWFTRCGHGVGFWDRDLGAVGDRLTDHAQAFGERSLYRGDDGLLYLD